MRTIIIILSIIGHTAWTQITLKECVESGLANKATLKSANTEVILANLKSVETKAKYLPQITLAYEYRYNSIIATQLVPVGQFNPVPTDETRGIQFGTKWQQNAGISLYQPLVDWAVSSRLKENKLSESLAQTDRQKAEDDLLFEIAKTYSQVLNYDLRVNEAIADTLRTYQSWRMVSAKFNEGNVLKTELNNAQINHNNNLNQFKTATASLVNEKIYLHYLTNISLERLLDEKLLDMPAVILGTTVSTQALETTVDFQRLLLEEKLMNQQIRTDRKKYTPTVGLQGFLGANQFSQTLNPFLSQSWFGNSYIGLTAKLPIFSSDKAFNAGEQLQNQLVILNHKKDDLKAKKNNELLQIQNDIKQLTAETQLIQNNVTLLTENVSLYRERLQSGQFAATELNVQEAELQKVVFQLKQIKEQLNNRILERAYMQGALGEGLKKL